MRCQTQLGMQIIVGVLITAPEMEEVTPSNGDGNQIWPQAPTMKKACSPRAAGGPMAHGAHITTPSRQCLDAFKNGRNTLASANAHGHQRIAPTGALQLVNGFGGDDGACGAYGVAQRDARAVGVDFGRV